MPTKTTYIEFLQTIRLHSDILLKWLILLGLLFHITLICVAINSFFLQSTSSVHFVSPVANSASGFSNETLLGILGLIISFAALLAYVFRVVVRKDLLEEIHITAEEERIASKIEARIVQAKIQGMSYKDMETLSEFIATHTTECRQTDCTLFSSHLRDFVTIRRAAYIHACYKISQTALTLTKSLHTNNHLDVILKAKNNLAYAIVLKKKVLDEQIPIEEIAFALQVRNELWDVITLKDIKYSNNKLHDITSDQIASFKDTIGNIDATFTQPGTK